MIFSRFGKILSCEVIRDKTTGDSLQYAFIEFENQKECEQAYFKMQDVLIDDHRIHVDFSQSVGDLQSDLSLRLTWNRFQSFPTLGGRLLTRNVLVMLVVLVVYLAWRRSASTERLATQGQDLTGMAWYLTRMIIAGMTQSLGIYRKEGLGEAGVKVRNDTTDVVTCPGGTAGIEEEKEAEITKIGIVDDDGEQRIYIWPSHETHLRLA